MECMGGIKYLRLDEVLIVSLGQSESFVESSHISRLFL